MKFFPVWPPIALTTEGMSALTKLSVTISSANAFALMAKVKLPTMIVERLTKCTTPRKTFLAVVWMSSIK